MTLLMSLALADRINLLRKEKEELRRISTTDYLTRIDNRRKLEAELERLIPSHDDGRRRFSIIIADVDHFKDVNDTYGHQAGDAILSEIAGLLAKSTRSTDHVGRWGGEEFLILCEGASREGALATAEKLRREIESHVFPCVGSVTCSFGVGAYESGASKEEVFRRADKALYCAKTGGRNRVEG
jgi:diguanylate cyclase (GGDEF)-like protein